MQRISTKDKIKKAGLMINEGKVDNLEMLYMFLPKRVVADILGVNSVRFSNVKSNYPADFKVGELIKLSAALDVEFDIIVNIFKNSLSQTVQEIELN
ncbi:MAG: hypothetical protein EOP43_01780 [Sphingobacteriaceae bacterium]|nr:MAG: hypothetical protein EOP43_01780 [Sphingobacteriaceae bacterium]